MKRPRHRFEAVLAHDPHAVYRREMSLRHYDTRHGAVSLRPETPDDEPFLRSLFASHAARDLIAAGLDEAAIGTMIAMQYRAADQTQRSQFPDAAYSIIESEGAAIGRLIEHDEGERVYFVDFALLPERRAQGLGTAFIEKVANEWAAKGRAARVEVLYTNRASLRLCEKLGFVLLEDMRNGYVNLLRPLETASADAQGL